jgi:hypothetical protein
MYDKSAVTRNRIFDGVMHYDAVCLFVCLFVFLALQPIVVVFSHPGSGL